MLVAPDGRVIGVGNSHFCDSSGACGGHEASIVALLPSGALDAGFGQGGKVRLPPASRARLYAAALQPDGKLLVAGAAGGAPGGMLVARLLPDGRPDPGFGEGGLRVYPGRGSAEEIVVQPDGRIAVLAGDALVGLLPDGQIDRGFGESGEFILRFEGGEPTGSTLSALPDGRLLVSFGGRQKIGEEPPLTVAAFVFLRLLPDGRPDPSFGENGLVSHSTDLQQLLIEASAFDQRGHLLLLVRSHDGPEDNWKGYLARMRFDGSFDEAGLYDTLDTPSREETIWDLALHPGGGVVAVGGAGLSEPPQLFVVRFSRDGEFETDFGDQGLVSVADVDGRAVAVLPDGEIVVAGDRVSGAGRQFHLRYYTQRGALTLVTSLAPAGRSAHTAALLGDAEGGLILVGSAAGASGADIALARLIARGKPDQGFGAGGWALTDLGQNEWASAAALLPDGRIVVAGHTMPGDDLARMRPFVARYLPDGRPDPSLGGGGHLLVAEAPLRAVDLAVQPDGKLLLALEEQGEARPRARVLRLLEDGRPDPSFGAGGAAPAGWGEEWRHLTALALDSAGFITVVGCDRGNEIQLARLNRWGEPDRTFSGGEARAQFGDTSCARAAVYEAAQDAIYLGGQRFEGEGALGAGVIYGSRRPNGPPAGAPESYTAAVGAPLVQAAPGVLANDRDPEADRLVAELVRGPEHGALALRPDGGFTYTPRAGFSGADGFVYRVSDGLLSSAEVEVRITVTTAPPGPAPQRARAFLPLLLR